ncbi:DNA adenine methylase [Chloracidobacterium thermophilum]|uniref:DNA adenine methylase n=1 Tax=Chloracidobacterium thermophilum TaxID=458033 RepID=UPI000738A9D3|nr:DNA adenine methylase [Chloracidobacterium thermophilum]
MPEARPFLKWAGGKSQLLDQLENHYPSDLRMGRITHYVEPFLGGGAVFFAIARRYPIKSAYLSDINRDLVLTYQAVQQRPAELLEVLERYQKEYDRTPEEQRRDMFLAVRDAFNQSRFDINHATCAAHWVQRAAQLIFLNKTCFNGLFRLNSKGAFNVPFGKYKTAVICDAAGLLAASRALQKAEIRQADYTECWDKVNENTFVYFDPPYRPLSRTASFTTYTGGGFSDAAQIRLAQFFRRLDREKKARLMLSNSDPTNENPDDTFFERIYSGYNVFKVSAGRAINSNGEKRGKISELLMTNYPCRPQSAEIQ